MCQKERRKGTNDDALRMDLPDDRRPRGWSVGRSVIGLKRIEKTPPGEEEKKGGNLPCTREEITKKDEREKNQDPKDPRITLEFPKGGWRLGLVLASLRRLTQHERCDGQQTDRHRNKYAAGTNDSVSVLA